MESVSVVFLTYNNYEKFLRCMNTMFYFITDDRIKEILILDNGSYQVELKDFLEKLEEQIAKVRVIFSDENLGIAKGRKMLFDIASGDYIISLDSDVVILNPPAFLEVFFRALEIEDMMMVGGGGGDHPYFPSMEREDINNKDSPDTPEELKVVDEIAGWFTGFKSSILKKNGGEIEMDERFSPFWAEDSDFCVQIKLAGGKCCIMGKGLISHQWSSCSKKETQVTLEEMWNKFQDKWYPRFGDKFLFDIDEKFYEENYPESKNLLRRKEFYLKVGIIRGDISSKNVVQTLFKDAYFKDNKTISYKDFCLENNEIVEKKKDYNLKDFVEKYINYESISKENFKILKNNLDKNFKDLIILSVYNEIECLSILNKLSSMQNINVCICICNETNYYSISNLLEKNNNKHCLCLFKPYDFDLISFYFCFNELSKNHKFERVLNLSTKRNQDYFLSLPLENITEGGIVEKNVSKIDGMNISILGLTISLDGSMVWDKECVYFEKTSYYNKFFNSYPFREIFDKCLRIVKKYENHVTPRCSPYHALERLFGFMKQKINDKKTLCIVLADLNDKNDLKKIKKNLEYFKNCEILVFNKGKERHIKPEIISCDHFFHISEKLNLLEMWKNGLALSELEDFNNVIFTDDSYSIESDIDEFLERARYKNLAMIREEEKFNLKLFSIVSENIGIFINKCDEEEKDLEEKISSKIMREINFTSVWRTEKQETDDEIIYEYKKEGKDNGEDYPLI